MKMGEDDVCPVCLAAVEDGQGGAFYVSRDLVSPEAYRGDALCRHVGQVLNHGGALEGKAVMHLECLKQLLLSGHPSSNRCPICRTELVIRLPPDIVAAAGEVQLHEYEGVPQYHTDPETVPSDMEDILDVPEDEDSPTDYLFYYILAALFPESGGYTPEQVELARASIASRPSILVTLNPGTEDSWILEGWLGVLLWGIEMGSPGFPAPEETDRIALALSDLFLHLKADPLVTLRTSPLHNLQLLYPGIPHEIFDLVEQHMEDELMKRVFEDVLERLGVQVEGVDLNSLAPSQFHQQMIDLYSEVAIGAELFEAEEIQDRSFEALENLRQQDAGIADAVPVDLRDQWFRPPPQEE